jgi:6-methylsalicylate decarboxylase
MLDPSAQTEGAQSMSLIDVHAHYFPSAYADIAEPLGLGRMAVRPGQASASRSVARYAVENVEERLAAMDRAGVERQILSIIAAPYHPDEASAVAAARCGNDLYDAFCKAAPDRFMFWGSLPLPHVDASIAEVRRCMDRPGCAGVTIQCFCLDETIARPEFDPLYEELDRNGAVVFLHPCQNALCSALISDFGLTTCAGASMEDAVVALHLIAARIPHRYPRIRFIVPHLGGPLPMLLNRLDGQMPSEGLAERPSETARRFFYDTVGWGSEAALTAAFMAFGETQLLPGSDWPVLLKWESYTQTFDHIRRSNLPESAIDRIIHRNVKELLRGRLP